MNTTISLPKARLELAHAALHEIAHLTDMVVSLNPEEETLDILLPGLMDRIRTLGTSISVLIEPDCDKPSALDVLKTVRCKFPNPEEVAELVGSGSTVIKLNGKREAT